MQENNLYIVGVNSKSMSAAAFFSARGYRVHLLLSHLTQQQILKNYASDEPLLIKLQKGFARGSLSVDQGIDSLPLDETALYWLFFDRVDPQGLQECMERLSQNPKLKLVLSGVKPAGFFHELSETLPHQCVLYIPFLFLRDRSVYESISAPNLVLVGEKNQGGCEPIEAIDLLTETAKTKSVSDILSVEFARTGITNLLASRLSFINEFSRLADAVGADIVHVTELMKLDARVGTGYLSPSWGFGGRTLPGELESIIQSFQSHGIATNYAQAVRRINEEQKEIIFQKLWRYFGSKLKDKKILIWGAAYKPGSPRVVGSAIEVIYPLLLAHGAKVTVYEPNAQDELKVILGQEVSLAITATEGLEQADAVVILNWPRVEPPKDEWLVKISALFDAQNLITDPVKRSKPAFYTGIGQGSKV